jgi:hypothetical protein
MPLSIADLKKKYASIGKLVSSKKPEKPTPQNQKLATTSAGKKIRPPTASQAGAFTEVERAVLLRTVVDVLHAKQVQFNVWRRYGLSRIYFKDDSWLTYSTRGRCTCGPKELGKETTAYQIYSELGLKKAATRSVIL